MMRKNYLRRASLLMGLGAGMILGTMNISGDRTAGFIVGVIVLILGFVVLEFGGNEDSND